ncbi:MAG: Eco57I restriction-modification methylase domain-containing protein, partial [Anaerolineae bacterium]
LGAPLSFLDHHLRCGNSLIGVWSIEDYILPGTNRWGEVQRAAANVVQIAELSDVTLGEVEHSSELFASSQQLLGPTRRRLNVELSSEFDDSFVDVSLAAQLAYWSTKDRDEADPVTQQKYELGQTIAEHYHFFHWKLEFPDAFVDLRRGTWKRTGGFDAVVGNPPYVSTADIENRLRTYYRRTFRTPGKEMNTFALFTERSLDLVPHRRRSSYIVPDSFLNVRSYSELRAYILAQCKVVSLLEIPGGAFVEAIVGNSVVFIVEREEDEERRRNHSVNVYAGTNRGDLRCKGSVRQDVYSDLPDTAFATDTRLLQLFNKVRAGLPTLEEVADLRDGIKTGNNDRFVTDTRSSPQHKPILTNSDLERYHYNYSGLYVLYDRQLLDGPREESIFLKDEKIVLRQTGDRIVAALDRNQLYSLDNTHLILPISARYDACYLLALMNSRLIDFVYQFIAGESGRVYAQVRISNLAKLPIRPVNPITDEQDGARLARELVKHCQQGHHTAVVSQVEHLLNGDTDGKDRSDVVHDLLAYLAEQMIDMHKQKQARVDAFWHDLEAATDPATFDTLRNKGKWEQSLAKDPACAPYVDPDSRSTRNLDDSLGWDDACFQAFAQMLVGKTPVTPALTRVYTQHAPAYQALATRIQETDHLIDQIVYRLYGLTEEEIAVVEGRA